MVGSDEVVWAVDWEGVPASEPGSAQSNVPASLSAPPTSHPPVPAATVQSNRELVAQELVPGQHLKLTDLGVTDGVCQVSVQITAPAGVELDLCCAGLDGKDCLSDDRYFVFYNHLASPEGAITFQPPADGQGAMLQFALEKIPETIARLVVISASVGNAMQKISTGSVQLGIAGNSLAVFRLGGQELGPEKTLLILEIYRKPGDWKIAALGESFSGGLGALLQHFGANVD